MRRDLHRRRPGRAAVRRVLRRPRRGAAAATGGARGGSAGARRFGYRYTRALDAAAQARIWGLREAALGLSMAMRMTRSRFRSSRTPRSRRRRLRDYIDRFLAIVEAARHDGRRLRARIGRMPARPAGGEPEDRRRRATPSRRSRAMSPIWCSSSAARSPANMATAWSAARSCARCSGRCSTRRFATSSAPSIRTASSIPARSSTRRRSPPTCATARGYVTPRPADLLRLLRLRWHWAAPSTCAAASGPAARSSTGRCARPTWRRGTKHTRRAGAPTSCGSRWPDGWVRRAWATKA